MREVLGFVSLACVLCSCTYSISMAHTEGQASDVVDNQQDAKADVSPSLSVPVKPL